MTIVGPSAETVIRRRRAMAPKASGAAPTKGGDGGRAAPVKRGPHFHDNRRAVLAGADVRDTPLEPDATARFFASLVETQDPHDRAHGVRRLEPGASPMVDDSYTLLCLRELRAAHPGAGVGGLSGRPRAYPPSSVVSVVVRAPGGDVARVVGIDSAFDGWSAAADRLAREGVCLDGGWNRRGDAPGTVRYALAEARARLRPGQRLRDLIDRPTTMAPSADPEEREAERAAEAAAFALTGIRG